MKDGPATANYDEDLGPVALSDWTYKPGFELNEQAQMSRTGPPAADNVLVNGKGKSDIGTGEYFKLSVKKVSTVPCITPSDTDVFLGQEVSCAVDQHLGRHHVSCLVRWSSYDGHHVRLCMHHLFVFYA